MKMYFDRTAPLYLVEEGSFDAVMVDAPESTLTYVKKVAEIIKKMEHAIDEASAPEESAQNLANLLTYLVDAANFAAAPAQDEIADV